MSNAKIPIWKGLEPYGALNTDFRDYSQDKHHNQLAKDEMLDHVQDHHKPSFQNRPFICSKFVSGAITLGTKRAEDGTLSEEIIT